MRAGPSVARKARGPGPMTFTVGGPMSTMEIAVQHARVLRRYLDQHHLDVHRLWWSAFQLGGNVGETEIDAYVHECLHLPPAVRGLLVRAAQTAAAASSPPGHAGNPA